jgi:5-methylcytosine-specific restriction endonuclease McrBC GTP-binding regulatory subunit McrB
MNFKQQILFGSPGTGKSYKIDNEIIAELGIEDSANCIKSVFHPEYTYGDFIGKLLPITKDGQVEYNYNLGHFLKALAQAYKNIIKNPDKPDNVILVIDEINRGNSAAIFGNIFQLLDRDNDGLSTYEVTISDMEFNSLKDIIFTEDELKNVWGKIKKSPTGGEFLDSNKIEQAKKQIKYILNDKNIKDIGFISQQKIKIPPNLSIVCTMNTSDNSIYYMDSAFKRRWEWEFIDVKNGFNEDIVKNTQINYKDGILWKYFIDNINDFIIDNHIFIRGIEDKQIGYFFINIENEIVEKSQIKNKLMFFLWDSVFARDKTPLVKLLYGNDNSQENNKNLVTFGQFTKKVNLFIDNIMNISKK